jgi:hypothetical protein
MLEGFYSSALIPVLFCTWDQSLKSTSQLLKSGNKQSTKSHTISNSEREITNMLSINLSWSVASLKPAGKQDKVGGYTGECIVRPSMQTIVPPLGSLT